MVMQLGEAPSRRSANEEIPRFETAPSVELGPLETRAAGADRVSREQAAVWTCCGSMYAPGGMVEGGSALQPAEAGLGDDQVPGDVSEGEGVIDGEATRYGESYNGLPLGCGTGDYSSGDTDIVAVGPARYADWPCGTGFTICGSNSCILAHRQDACPGCGANHLDLSEAGIEAVCGPEVGRCEVTIEVMR